MITAKIDETSEDYERGGGRRGRGVRSTAARGRGGCGPVRGLRSPSGLAEVRERLHRYEREIAPTLEPAYRVYEANGKAIRNLFHLEKYDSFFASLAERQDIQELISSLVHGEPV